MSEQDKIQSIIDNGGQHLKTYKKENISYDMCLTAVSDDGWAIVYVPDQFKTKKMYTTACKTSGSVLRIVPEEYMSSSLCMHAVKSEGTALQYVPEEYLTPDICFKAVCNDSLAFKYVPKSVLTPSFCAKAVNKVGADCLSSLPNNCRNIAFYESLVEEAPNSILNIPKKYRNAKVCETAIKGMGFSSIASAIKKKPDLFCLLHPSLYDHDASLAFVKSKYFVDRLKMPEKGTCIASIIDNELYMNGGADGPLVDLNKLLAYNDVCKEAVKANRLILESVPSDLITDELCEISVNADAYSFRYVPEKCKTEGLCKLAFEKDPANFEFIPDDIKTSQMCLEASRHSGHLLKYIPDHFFTYEMCESALAKNTYGMEYVPDRLFDKKLALLALSTPNPNGLSCLSKIPERLRDHDVCLAAVVRQWSDIHYVPENLIDTSIRIETESANSEFVRSIPHDYFTPEVCINLVKHGTQNFNKIPKDCLTEEICLEAVKHKDRLSGHTVLVYIPKELLTQEICDVAFETDLMSYKSIPEQFVSEDMIMRVAQKNPGLFLDYFPQKYQTKEFLEKLQQYPTALYYLKNVVRL